nr:hypothetical protein [Sphingomonas solaris]
MDYMFLMIEGSRLVKKRQGADPGIFPLAVVSDWDMTGLILPCLSLDFGKAAMTGADHRACGAMAMRSGPKPLRMRRHADRTVAIGNVFEHDCIGAHRRPVTDADRADQLGAGEYHHVVAKPGIGRAESFALSRRAERDLMVERAARTDAGAAADHDAVGVRQAKARTDHRRRLDETSEIES